MKQLKFPHPSRSVFCSILSAAFLVLESAHGAPAIPGGTDHGGGGDTRGSTTAEVVAAIHQVIDEPTNYLPQSDSIYRAFNNLRDIPAMVRVHVPRLQLVIGKMNSVPSADRGEFTDSAVYRDLKATHFDIRESRNCPSDGSRTETHAFTLHQMAAPICLGVPLLRRIPKASLTFQIRALVAHELAHHFGYDEVVANQVQNLFLTKNVGTIDDDYSLIRLQVAYDDLTEKLERVQSALKETKLNTGFICYDLGGLEETANATKSAVLDGMAENRKNQSEPTLFAPFLARSRSIYEDARYLKGYCYYDQVGSDKMTASLLKLQAEIKTAGKEFGLQFRRD